MCRKRAGRDTGKESGKWPCEIARPTARVAMLPFAAVAHGARLTDDTRGIDREGLAGHGCLRSPMDHEALIWPSGHFRAKCTPGTQGWSGRVNVSSEAAHKSMMPPFLSAVVHACALLCCALVFSFLSAGTAQAHALHPPEASQVQVPADTASSSLAETGNGAAPALSQSECGVECCSPTHCTSGLVEGSGPAALFVAVQGESVLPPAIDALPFEQATLKRPPRS